MKTLALSAVFLTSRLAALSAGPTTLQGTYVEARTSEVFAGACIINGEAATTGREALLAWKVDSGQFNGVPLDGLAVVAAISGDANLSVHEIGGDVATTAHGPLRRCPGDRRPAQGARHNGEDARDSDRRRQSPKSRPRRLSSSPATTRFALRRRRVRLAVRKEMSHDSSCGNKQWFEPLSTLHHAEMGITVENAFSGTSLGTKWSDPNKRSGFFGTFSF